MNYSAACTYTKTIKESKIYKFILVRASKNHSGYKIAALKKRNRTTRRILQLQDDWLQSEFKQLDQYRDQYIFDKPTKLSRNSNILQLL